VSESLANLSANNEKTELRPNATDAADYAADELFDARLIFKDDDGQRYSEYGRLVRIGRAVAIVEAGRRAAQTGHGSLCPRLGEARHELHRGPNGPRDRSLACLQVVQR
jgi:hypothetical protein